MRLITPFIIAVFLCWMPLANAKKPPNSSSGQRTRIIHFSQTGINLVKLGLANDLASSCVIVISNNSSVEQNVLLNSNSTADGVKKGDAKCSLESGKASPLDFPGTTIAPGDAPLVVRCVYPEFPAKKTGQQVIVCAGNIEAKDTASSPGMIEASASLEVFVETERGYKNVDKDGKIISEGNGSYPVFNSVPVTINGGKAF